MGLVFRRGKPPVVPSSIVESSNSTSLCLSALFSNRVGSHERLGPCGDRPTPCCSAHRALGALRLSNVTLHYTLVILCSNTTGSFQLLVTLIDMCLSVHPLRMPLGPPPLPHRSPRPPPSAPSLGSPLIPRRRTFSPGAGI